MCIAIYQDPGARLTEDEFRTSWQSNPDGGGLAWLDDTGTVRTFKSMKLRPMMDKYEQILDLHGAHTPVLVHFRIATHGTVNEYNCHPFMVNSNIAVIHNGIIPVLIDKKDNRSDTRVFTEEYLPKLPAGWLDDDYLFDMVEEYIGSSKLVFLTTENRERAYIANEHQGHWNTPKNIWFSNKSYCKAPAMYGSKNSGKWQQPSMVNTAFADDDYDDATFGLCKFCTAPSVYDGVCYECEICQSCSMTDDYCQCYTTVAQTINSMTSEQFLQFDSPV